MAINPQIEYSKTPWFTLLSCRSLIEKLNLSRYARIAEKEIKKKVNQDDDPTWKNFKISY